jgi:hypothetical protein
VGTIDLLPDLTNCNYDDFEIPAYQSVSQFVIPAKSREAGREPGSRNAGFTG